jgi:hypothetical protein
MKATYKELLDAIEHEFSLEVLTPSDNLYAFRRLKPNRQRLDLRVDTGRENKRGRRERSH